VKSPESKGGEQVALLKKYRGIKKSKETTSHAQGGGQRGNYGENRGPRIKHYL